MSANGSCLCGAVRYTVSGQLRPVIACHCNQCRKTSGHFVAATSAERSLFSISGDEHLTWFDSSPGVRRGFCRSCGSQLFWDVAASDRMSIFAGTLDGTTGLNISEHIFCESKGDYYTIDDGVPRYDAYPPGEEA